MNYCGEIAKYLQEKTDGLIVDVGCNDGTFLDLLSRKGLDKLLGIEPSAKFADLCKLKGYKIENCYFDRGKSRELKEKYGVASAVIYRHVLEHVHSPFDFILAARNLLKEKGKLIIEIPNSENILNGLNVHELLDQHILYFTPKNLEQIVNRAGFSIEGTYVQPYMGTDAIILYAFKDDIVSGVKKDFNFSSGNYENFSYNWEILSKKIRKKVRTLKSPIIGLGASHPQSRFFIFSGIGNSIHKLIDDDPMKIGKYIHIPNPVKIISTEQFINKPTGTLLHTAFGHDNWLKKIIQSSKGKNDVFIFNKKLNETKL